MTFSTQKRFIAGVVCPQCSAVDKIRAFNEDGTDYRECVSCGFKDQIRIVPAPRELNTRVNQQEPAEQPSKIKFVDPT